METTGEQEPIIPMCGYCGAQLKAEPQGGERCPGCYRELRGVAIDQHRTVGELAQLLEDPSSHTVVVLIRRVVDGHVAHFLLRGVVDPTQPGELDWETGQYIGIQREMVCAWRPEVSERAVEVVKRATDDIVSGSLSERFRKRVLDSCSPDELRAALTRKLGKN